MRKIRLLITEHCDRNCSGCCNKDFDLKSLPVCTDFGDGPVLIMLTGGEPLLYPVTTRDIVKRIRMQNPEASIILYTTMALRALDILPYLDGLTLTLHDQSDVGHFMQLDGMLELLRTVDWVKNKSLRLNVFKEVQMRTYRVSDMWEVKKGIVWIKNCPLPKDEVFMRLPGMISHD